MTDNYSMETEESFLSAIINDPRCMAEAVTHIPHKQYFYFSFHQELYDCMLTLFDKSEHIDNVTLYELMSARHNKPDVSSRISAIAGTTGHASVLKEYSGIMRDRFIRREAIENANRIIQMVQHEDSADEILGRFQESYLDMTQQQNRETTLSIERLANMGADYMTELSKNGDKFIGLGTGLSGVDMKLGGLKPEQLVILASRPSVGKSAIALNILYDICFKQKKKALMFSLEMSARQIMLRLYALATEIDHYALRTGQAMKSSMMKHKIEVFASECKENNNLFMYDGAIVTLQDVRAEAIKTKELNGGLDIICIDYLQLLHCSKAERREQEIAKMTRGLKILSKELQVPILLLSQLSRMSEQTNSRPQLHNLRESGAIEQDADMVLFLHRPEAMGMGDKLIEVITAKNRDGACGIDELTFKDNICKFQEKGNQFAEVNINNEPR